MAGPLVAPDGARHADLLQYARDEVRRFQDLRLSSIGSNAEAADSFDSFNFGDRNLRSLPEEIVDIIKDHTVRIALDRNKLTSLSGLAPRIGEFHRLKYLVLRHNQLEDFPTAVFDCPGLEYLDLKSNLIRSLPEDLNRLKSIKVISVKNNQIRRLPLCIGQMTSLQFMTTKQNPIEFPHTREWRIPSRNSDQEADDKRRLVEETTKLKKVLQKYATMSPTPTSDFGDPISETPRPLRSARGGRFPIRPSVSSVSVSSMNLDSTPQPSPPQARPSLSSTKTSSRIPSAGQSASGRPSVDPLLNGDGDRHRSNSESQMSTSVRRKRMGMQVSRGGKGSTELVEVDGDADSQTHNREISNSSLLSNAMSLDGTDSSPTPDTPPQPLQSGPRETTASRLSSLPENKRKSQYVDPYVELAQSITFAVEQLESPIRAVVNATKSSSSRRRSLERSSHSAFTTKRDLSDHLIQLGIHDEENESDESPKGGDVKALGSIGDRCERCIESFEKLLLSLQRNTVIIVEHTNPKYVRLLMHMLFAAVVEVQNSYNKFALSAAGNNRSMRKSNELAVPLQRQPSRAASPSPRPTTSLRIKRPSDLRSDNVMTYLKHKPLPSPRMPGSDSAGLSRTTSRSGTRMEPRHASRSTLSPSASFGSSTQFSSEYDREEQEFERIFAKLNAATDNTLRVLPQCTALLQESRQRYAGLSPQSGRVESFDLLVHLSSQAQSVAADLKSRLKSLRIREPRAVGQTDFWQLCTAYTRAFYDFLKALKVQTPLLDLGTSIQSVLRPLHEEMKSVVRAIDQSPWRDQAVVAPLSAHWGQTFSPSFASGTAYLPSSNPTSATTPRSRQNQPPPLQLNSSFSSVSSLTSQNGGSNANGSGYTTPLPATPISASLGPAAQAILGDGLGLQQGLGYFNHGGPSPIGGGVHDPAVASVAAMPGWYNSPLDSMGVGSGMNRSASSASIRGLATRPNPTSVNRSMSHRR